jgi:hypothetical protein
MMHRKSGHLKKTGILTRAGILYGRRFCYAKHSEFEEGLIGLERLKIRKAPQYSLPNLGENEM